MADIAATIGGGELRLMQAWLNRDEGTVRKLMHRDCTIMVGTNPPQLLDRPSFLAAIEHGLVCTRFRLGEALINRHGKSVWWSSGAELELKLGRTQWSGQFLISDMWRKSAFSGWKLMERSLAVTAPDTDNQLASHLRQLQLWR